MNQTTKHTPGSWRTEGWENLVVNAADGSTILACPGAGKGATLAEFKANARLIAAAPEMAEALPALIECAEILAAQCRVSGDEGHARMYQARAEAGRAALAKAEGR